MEHAGGPGQHHLTKWSYTVKFTEMFLFLYLFSVGQRGTAEKSQVVKKESRTYKRYHFLAEEAQ